MKKHTHALARSASVQSLGGRALIGKDVPAACPRCKKGMRGRVYHSYLGHLGLHGLADKYFGGDLDAAQKRLRENGLARQDPAPWNGAWRRYQPIPVKVDVGGEWMEF